MKDPELKVNCLVCGEPMRHRTDIYNEWYECSDNDCSGLQSIKAAATLAAKNQRLAELEEALTPSGDTKAAYIGEFEQVEECCFDGCCEQTIQWTTIKEIMAAIRSRAEQRKRETK